MAGDPVNEHRTLLHAGALITADANNAVLHNQGILIEDGLIQAVDNWAHLASADGAHFIDASAHTVLPGLIDAHTHVVHNGDPDEDWRLIALTELTASTALKAAQNARRHVEMGVTTIRDVGAWDWVDIALRDAINAGWQSGPRMLVAGHGITSTGGHMDARKFARPGVPSEALASIGAVADSPEQARAAAWEQLMRGADLLKLNATLSEYVRASGGQCSPELTFECMRVICEIAHNTGRKVAAHCHGGPGVQAAIDAGVDTFEHGRFLTDQHLDQMAEKGRFLVPTLSPEAWRVAKNDPPTDPATRRWYATATEVMYDSVARAHQRGVRVAAGTDAGMPYVFHGSLAFEMEHLARAGLSNLDVVAAATRVSAQALGMEETVGQVQPGFCADLLVVDGDPVRDLAILQRAEAIKLVMQHGRVTAERVEPRMFGNARIC
jgi:imidazolonepropionase-like amidohydrolase